MFASWKVQFDKDIKRLRWKYRILKIKWVLLFVLPILIVIVAYQTAKQYLKIRMRDLGKRLKPEVGDKDKAVPKT